MILFKCLIISYDEKRVVFVSSKFIIHVLFDQPRAFLRNNKGSVPTCLAAVNIQYANKLIKFTDVESLLIFRLSYNKYFN